MNGQLELDFTEDFEARLRAEVTEPGMSEGEIVAAVEDARRRLAIGPTKATKARPCVCERPMLFVAKLGERTCGLCGREPRS